MPLLSLDISWLCRYLLLSPPHAARDAAAMLMLAAVAATLLRRQLFAAFFATYVISCQFLSMFTDSAVDIADDVVYSYAASAALLDIRYCRRYYAMIWLSLLSLHAAAIAIRYAYAAFAIAAMLPAFRYDAFAAFAVCR